MNTQKRNKIIVLIFIIMILISFLILSQYLIRHNYIQTKLVHQCEKILKQNNKDSLICKVGGNNTLIMLDEEEEKINPQVKPNDTVIFSLDLPKLIQSNQNQYVRNAFFSIDAQQKVSICFNIYPIILREDLAPPFFTPLDISGAIIKDFYDNYKWNVILNRVLLDDKTKGDNFICTQPTTLGRYSQASVIFTIPPEAKLILSGDSHSRNYGVKISLIPPSLMSSLINPELIVQSSSQLIHFFSPYLPINFK